ncbi:ABC transporter substrate-binding protein [Natrialba hulunbeirensis]|uniref:ABC transporter substrate-binding protein n=1 Tax=Natrialba hulunbeirensis TaxID=123783 RepID=UPI000A04F6A6|nr:ABC transporter substrate-binding protein [Natrialba hulunbeirensis]
MTDSTGDRSTSSPVSGEHRETATQQGQADGDKSGARSLRRRRFLQATAATTATASLAGCTDSYETLVESATSNEDDDTVTIGVLAPNPDSDFIGRSMAQAAQVAVEELNENGGINGHEVELSVRDTNASASEARRQYQQLILEDGAVATTGVFDSPALVNIMDDIAEQETIHLTTGAAAAHATRLVNEQYDEYKYHFRVGVINEFDLGRAKIDFLDDMADEIGWESIAALAEDYQWSEGIWEATQDRLDDLDLDVVMEERYPPATDDFTDLYSEAAAEGADAVLITAAHTGNEATLDWAYPNRPEQQPQPQPFAFGGTHVPMQLPSYYEQTDGACQYGFSQINATAQSTTGELTQEFVSTYQDRFDGESPVYTGYGTYDAVLVYAEAVEAAGTFDADDVVPELESIQFSGASGPVEFYDPTHEFAHDLAYEASDPLYFQWQEDDDGTGVQEIIWPEEEATSQYQSPAWLQSPSP